MQSVVKTQPQRMTSHTCENGEEFVLISSLIYWSNLFKLMKATQNINNVQELFEMDIM